MKEMLIVLRLIANSPNLQELQISVSVHLFGHFYKFGYLQVLWVPIFHLFFCFHQGSSNTSAATEALDLDFWEEDCPSDCALEQLKTVKMADLSGVPHEMEFIRFLLGNAPMLEIMSITPSVYVTEGRLNMLIELVRFRRASAQAEIIFIQDQV